MPETARVSGIHPYFGQAVDARKFIERGARGTAYPVLTEARTPRAGRAVRARGRIRQLHARVHQRRSSRIICAPFSAIIAVGVLVLPEVIVGMTEASTMRSAPMP